MVFRVNITDYDIEYNIVGFTYNGLPLNPARRGGCFRGSTLSRQILFSNIPI